MSLKLGQAGIPLIVTNHTYEVVGAYVPTKEMGGGTGLKYSASSILFLSKKKEKDGTDIVGNIIKVKAQKSRFTKENSQIETSSSMTHADLTSITDYWNWVRNTESSSGGVIGLLLGNLPFILLLWIANPEKYFTPEVMQALDECARKEFLYGSGDE